MKSFHVLGSRQFGGADRFFVRLVQALNTAGHEAVAVTRPASPVAQALQSTDVRQIHLPLANGWDGVSAWRLRRRLREEAPDAVQTYMGRATRLTRVPRRLPAPHIARLGGYYKIRGYYEHCDVWVGNTRGICDYLIAQGLPAERVAWIGNFVPPPEPVDPATRDRLRQALRLPAEAYTLLALGRFIEKKGFGDLLQAFARLPRDVADRPPHLVLIGDGPLRDDLRALADTLGIADRVHWAGWQNRPEPYLQLADALVCPSRHEPLGNVILEGWNHRLPVVSTASDGARELITDDDTGLLAPCADPDALAARMTDLLRLPAAQRQALAAAGHRTLIRHHGEDAVVQAYLDLYTRWHGRRR